MEDNAVLGTLEGFAALPADTFAEGPPTGEGIDANGRTGPFEGPPVQGFSGVQFAPGGDGSNYWFLSDNGFGSKANSPDYLLRLYQVDPNFVGSEGGDGSADVQGFVQLSDPDNLIPFDIQTEGSVERNLTGSDFDVESFVIDGNGDIWIGEEFGPYLLHFDSTGKLVEAPIATPNITSFNTLNGQDPLVIGHRGASGLLPEHTLEAYSTAIAQGADFIEPDLVITKDGVLIARHEPMLDDTTNVAEVFGEDRMSTKLLDGAEVTAYFAEDFTLAEIKQLRAVQSRSYREQGFNNAFEIPTFEEVIELVKQAEADTGKVVGIYPETKHPTFFDEQGMSLEEPLIATLQATEFTDPDRIFIQSFELQNVIELDSKLLPEAGLGDVPVVQLFGDTEGSFINDGGGGFSVPYDFVVNADKSEAELREIYGDLVDVVDFTSQPTYEDLANPEAINVIGTYAEGLGPWKNNIILREGLDEPVDGDGDGNAEITTQLTGEIFPLVNYAHDAGLQVHPYTLRDEERFLTLNADGSPQTPEQEFVQLTQIGVDGFFTDFPATGVAAVDKITSDFVYSPDNPAVIAGDVESNLSRSRGYEGLAFSPDRQTIYPMLEGTVLGDPTGSLRIYEFDVASSAFEGLVGLYQMDEPNHAIGDFTPINEDEFLVIERDGKQAEDAAFKKIFKVNLSELDDAGFVEKELVVDLLNIADPDDLNGDGKTTFDFPFVTIEDVLVLDEDTILVANDNNYPFSIGRDFSGQEIDNNEIIQIKLNTPLEVAPELGTAGFLGSDTDDDGTEVGSDANETPFRVNPYLQQPSSDGTYITWFTEEGTAGEVTITGPGLDTPLSFTTAPTFEPLLSYTTAEKNQEIEGLDPGSWLLGDENYKHTVDVEGLAPNSTYNYSVTVGDRTFESTFTTAPTADDWDQVRFMVFSDSETEPAGRVQRRDWQQGALATDSLERPSAEGTAWAETLGTRGDRLNYPLTQTVGYQNNLAIINEREPDFLVMPGDLIQGGGYQPAWDEFFRHNAGEFDSGLSEYPILPALGNWENFGALNGGYGIDDEGRYGPLFGREKYHVYFDAPENGTPEHQDNYYRIDYGPITILTLDSSNGEPDDSRDNYGGEGQPAQISGQEFTGPGTDTQQNITREQYESEGGTDLADFNPGSPQWNWVAEQLEDARAEGQIVFAQFHHAPFSSGTHGLPMNHEDSSGQGGTPMRQYHSLFESYGVAAVFSGHSEMFERSFVDEDGDGVGVNYYDVGVAGDGMRGQRQDDEGNLLGYNAFSQWTADQSEPETWAEVDGVLQNISGGKHYGHLEVNVERLDGGAAEVTFTPVYSFPMLDANYELVETERRVYGDEIVLTVNADGVVIAGADDDGIEVDSNANEIIANALFEGNADDGIDIEGDNSNVVIQEISSTGNGEEGLEIDGSFNAVSVMNASFSSNGEDGFDIDETGRGNSITVSDAAFSDNGDDGFDVFGTDNNITWSNVTSSGNAEEGFEIDGDDNLVSISYSSLSGNGDDGFQIDDEGSGNSVNFSNTTLANNVDGVDINGNDNLITFFQVGISDNSGTALEVEGDNNIVTISHSTFSNNGEFALLIEGSNNRITIADSAFLGSGSGILDTGSNNIITVINSTIAGDVVLSESSTLLAPMI